MQYIRAAIASRSAQRLRASLGLKKAGAVVQAPGLAECAGNPPRSWGFT